MSDKTEWQKTAHDNAMQVLADRNAELMERIKQLTAAAEVGESMECDQCGGTGFDTPGTGYGNVCSKCGGTSAMELAMRQDRFEPIIKYTIAATIERCAQVAEETMNELDGPQTGRHIAAAIRALKDKP